jgi:hypothetical protein
LARLFVALLAIVAVAVGLWSAHTLPDDAKRPPIRTERANTRVPAEPKSASPVPEPDFEEQVVVARLEGSLIVDRAMARYREGIGLFAEGDYYGALAALSAADEALPDFPPLCFALARVYHVLNLTREAVALLPCMRLEPRFAALEPMRRLVEKLERSAEFELEFDAVASDHFVASFPSEGTAAERIGEVLDMLERARDDIGWLLGIEATRQIPVVVYEAVDFGEATGAPDWAGGLYDGKIRISMDFFERDPVRFADSLRHEYMHAALHERTGGRMPAWMNEGLANQVTERGFDRDGLRRHLRSSDDFLTEEMLSRSFGHLESQTASLAYQQAYWMTDALIDEHGFEAVEALIADLESDPLRRFDESFEAQFGEWPDVYLARWHDDFVAE